MYNAFLNDILVTLLNWWEAKTDRYTNRHTEYRKTRRLTPAERHYFEHRQTRDTIIDKETETNRQKYTKCTDREQKHRQTWDTVRGTEKYKDTKDKDREIKTERQRIRNINTLDSYFQIEREREREKEGERNTIEKQGDHNALNTNLNV